MSGMAEPGDSAGAGAGAGEGGGEERRGGDEIAAPGDVDSSEEEENDGDAGKIILP